MALVVVAGAVTAVVPCNPPKKYDLSPFADPIPLLLCLSFLSSLFHPIRFLTSLKTASISNWKVAAAAVDMVVGEALKEKEKKKKTGKTATRTLMIAMKWRPQLFL